MQYSGQIVLDSLLRTVIGAVVAGIIVDGFIVERTDASVVQRLRNRVPHRHHAVALVGRSGIELSGYCPVSMSRYASQV